MPVQFYVTFIIKHWKNNTNWKYRFTWGHQITSRSLPEIRLPGSLQHAPLQDKKTFYNIEVGWS